MEKRDSIGKSHNDNNSGQSQTTLNVSDNQDHNDVSIYQQKVKTLIQSAKTKVPISQTITLSKKANSKMNYSESSVSPVRNEDEDHSDIRKKHSRFENLAKYLKAKDGSCDSRTLEVPRMTPIIQGNKHIIQGTIEFKQPIDIFSEEV